MFNINRWSRIGLAMIGSLILTTVVVGAAVGPARAVETSPVVAFQLAPVTQVDA